MIDGSDRSGEVRVPGAGASVDEILEFAATYDAYEHFAAEPAQLERTVGSLYAEITATGTVPEWVRLDLARATLFYAYRSDYHGGGYGSYEPMAALVDHIRSISGGRVVRRDRHTAPGANAANPVSDSTVVDGFEDSWEYSDDGVYRWWYERRWEPGPTLCFVGLNPATGDTDNAPRPTLAKVVTWARRQGCGAVVVVTLFAYRATDPAALFSAPVDIIGDRNDDTIEAKSAAAHVTLAGWGAHRLARDRARDVIALLRDPWCAGHTKHGAPRHPLYVPTSRQLARFN